MYSQSNVLVTVLKLAATTDPVLRTYSREIHN